MKILIATYFLSAFALPIAFSATRPASRPMLDPASPLADASSPREPNLLRTQHADADRFWRLAVGAPAASAEHGAEVYQANCMACHGANRAGVNSTFPSLIGVRKRYSDAQIANQIRNGKGRMLAFPYMSDADLNSLLLFLKTPATAKPAKVSTLRQDMRELSSAKAWGRSPEAPRP